MSARKHLITLLSVPFLAAPLSAFAGPSYTATFFPDYFGAGALGSRGEVVGYSGGAAAIWRDGAITTFSTGDDRFAMFTAISSNGTLAGTWDDPGGDGSAHMFIYKDGAMREIGNLYGNTFTYAVNSSGQVVGTAEGGHSSGAVLYSNGVLQRISGFAYSYAYDINDSGVAVGGTELANGSFQAYTYSNGVLTDIGSTAGASYSEARAINNAGDIVGSFITGVSGDSYHAFIYSNGVMRDIGTTRDGTAVPLDSSEANDINEFGQVVGRSYLEGIGWQAFFYSDGKMVDLNAVVSGTDGWTLVSASAINDGGQILAWACQDTNCRDVLLNPISAVPEPASWGMLISGLAGLLIRSSRRSRRQAR